MNATFGFLLFEQFEDLDFFGPWEILGLWSKQFNGPRLIIINESGNQSTSTKGLSIQAHTDFAHCPKLDYLLVPGGQGTRTEVNNDQLITFIQKQAANCDQILSVCTGVFLLQVAGLLNEKKAITHWASLDRLRNFSEVIVTEERFVHDGNIWTSAGISAGIDMALAFVSTIAGENTAGDIQLQAEYYPKTIIYPKNNAYLPGYVKNE